MTTPAEIPTAITIDESLTGRQQTRDYIHLVTVGSTRYRIDVHHDSSYASQSYANAEVWTADGWTNVVRIRGGDPRLSSLPSGYAPDAAEHLPHFRALSATLLAIALTVTERSL